MIQIYRFDRDQAAIGDLATNEYGYWVSAEARCVLGGGQTTQPGHSLKEDILDVRFPWLQWSHLDAEAKVETFVVLVIPT